MVPRALMCMLVMLTGGCAPDFSGSSSRQRAAETAPPIEMPDVSRLAKPVQAQIRERHAALMAKLEDRSTSATDLADAYGALGLVLMAAEYYEAAASCYLNAQALVPDAARWPYYLGHLYRIKGDAAKAAEFFSRALEAQPGDIATLIWLGEIYLDRGEPDRAEPLFVQALAASSSSAAALAGAGRTALAKRDFPRAIDHLERALAAEPRALGLHYSLAAAYRGLGQVDRARTHLERRGTGRPVPHDPLMEAYEAVLHTPLTYETQVLKALESGQLKEAADLFRKGLEVTPDDPVLLHRLGTALFMAGDTAGAVQQFERALQREPQFSKAHFGLGMILNLSGRHAEAIERFAAAVKYQPEYLEARLGLAESLRVAGRLEESLPHFDRIVKLDPSLAEAWVMYAMTLARLQRVQQACERLNEAGRIHPGEPELTDLALRLHCGSG